MSAIRHDSVVKYRRLEDLSILVCRSRRLLTADRFAAGFITHGQRRLLELTFASGGRQAKRAAWRREYFFTAFRNLRERLLLATTFKGAGAPGNLQRS